MNLKTKCFIAVGVVIILTLPFTLFKSSPKKKAEPAPVPTVQQEVIERAVEELKTTSYKITCNGHVWITDERIEIGIAMVSFQYNGKEVDTPVACTIIEEQ